MSWWEVDSLLYIRWNRRWKCLVSGLAPAPLTAFCSNSKFDQNIERVRWIRFNRSQRNFAHVMTVILLWRVQNFVVISRVHIKPEHCKFWSNSIEIPLMGWLGYLLLTGVCLIYFRLSKLRAEWCFFFGQCGPLIYPAIRTWKPSPHYRPFVSTKPPVAGGLSPQRACNAELWCLWHVGLQFKP